MATGHMGDAGDAEEEWRIHSNRTGDTLMSGGQELGAPGGVPRDSQQPERDGRHPHEDARRVICGTRA